EAADPPGHDVQQQDRADRVAGGVAEGETGDLPVHREQVEQQQVDDHVDRDRDQVDPEGGAGVLESVKARRISWKVENGTSPSTNTMSTGTSSEVLASVTTPCSSSRRTIGAARAREPSAAGSRAGAGGRGRRGGA